ncbi:MAG TPA: hypothetical protein VLW47_01910 [Thermodesulfobacteriota bacterium]|nr:hypothetical protein [Thermodesulfobacteriota bacterium]
MKNSRSWHFGVQALAMPLGLHPEPRGPRFLPVGELALWYGMFAPYGRFLGTTGFYRGAPFRTYLGG